jgi:hypothetical protein
MIKEVTPHINCNGMFMTYTRQTFHGETFSDDDSHIGEHGAYESDIGVGFEEGNETNCDNDACTMLADLEKCGIKSRVRIIFIQS